MPKRENTVKFLREFIADECHQREASCIPYSQADDREYVRRARKAVREIEKLGAAVEALKKIREMGYASQAARATDTVIACIRVAEEAILELGQ